MSASLSRPEMHHRATEQDLYPFRPAKANFSVSNDGEKEL